MMVAVQKLSLNFQHNMPSIPNAKLANATSSWKGLPAGHPIEAAIWADRKK